MDDDEKGEEEEEGGEEKEDEEKVDQFPEIDEEKGENKEKDEEKEEGQNQMDNVSTLFRFFCVRCFIRHKIRIDCLFSLFFFRQLAKKKKKKYSSFVFEKRLHAFFMLRLKPNWAQNS